MALNPNIILSGQGLNLPAIDTAVRRNRLADMKLELGEQKMANQNRLRELLPQAMQGNAMARAQVTGINPEFYDMFAKMDEREREAMALRMQDAGKAAAFVKQSDNPVAAYDQVRGWLTEKYPQMAGEIPQQYDPEFIEESILEVQSFEEMVGGDSSFSKSLTPAYDAQGNLVYVQGTDAGGARVVEGFKPLGPEYEGREAAAVALAKQNTPGGKAEVAADQAAAEAAQAKVASSERNREKVQSTRMRAYNIVNRLLDPSRREAMEAATGSISGRLPSIRQSVVDFENDVQALKAMLTTENLELLSGVLSNSDMLLLERVASGGLELTSSPARFQNTLEQIRAALLRGLENMQTGFQSPDQVQSAPMEEVRQYVESATAEELDELPEAVRNAIVKRLRGGSNGDGR